MSYSFINGYTDSLVSSCSPSDTVIHVLQGPPAGSTPQFVLLLDQELVLVTSYTGTALTVTRAVEPYNGVQTASGHGLGTPVSCVITAAMLLSIVGGSNPIGPAGGSLSGNYPNPGLANTAVTPGSYTLSNITVGADGRLTAASSGTAPGPAIGQTVGGSTSNAVLFVGAGNVLAEDVTHFSYTPATGLALGQNLVVTVGSEQVVLCGGTNELQLALGTMQANGIQYTWPSVAPTSGQVLTSGTPPTLTWTTPSPGGGTIGQPIGGSPVNYELLAAGPTGNLAQIPSLGAAGQVLTSLGPGAWPTWANATVPLVISTQTAGYQISTTDDVILASAAGASIIIVLPDLTVAGNQTKVFRIKRIDNIGANTVTVAPYAGNPSALIDGSASVLLSVTTAALGGSDLDSGITVCTDGVNWWILAIC